MMKLGEAANRLSWLTLADDLPEWHASLGTLIKHAEKVLAEHDEDSATRP